MKWLTSKETAGRMGIHPMTLARWRTEGKGPKYQKLGNAKASRVRYLENEVDRYLRNPDAYGSPKPQVEAS
ncbi:helix-turn-helix transcriptional regulator [Nocardia miyunensis]|uniref:helix-turn-helix transcriptional regulator n=1 Tax=Nocardia miyunensis TaxID=282684 RepID=UPI000830EF30|nr:helix-turn-helix domain-containing protein [Nocardia miyunensis]